MKERKPIYKVMAKRYQKASKKERSKLLDEFVDITAMNKSYAATLLRKHGIKLKKMSASTIDRVLKKERKKLIEEHKRLNLFELKMEITKCQNMLLQIQKQKSKGVKPTRLG